MLGSILFFGTILECFWVKFGMILEFSWNGLAIVVGDYWNLAGLGLG